MEKDIKNPKISIIIPVYNVERYLSECLESILNQSFNDYEILLVDDASTDHSRDICLSYAQKDTRIRILYNEKNLGLSLTRNHGMNEAKGEYIAFIDSDDLVGTNYLMALWTEAERQQADVVTMGYVDYREKPDSGEYYDSRQINIVKSVGVFTSDRKKRIETMCNWQLILVAWGKLYRRGFLIQHKFHFENILSEDILFNFAVLYAADKYVFISDNLYYYRKTGNSITRGGNANKLKKALQSVIMMHGLVNIYLKDMPVINSDKKMVRNIHDFFTEALCNYLFLNIADGLPEEDAVEVSEEVFNEYMPECAEFIGYMFRKVFVSGGHKAGS